MPLTSCDIIGMIEGDRVGLAGGGYEKYISLPILAKSLTNLCQNILCNLLPNSQSNKPHAMYIQLWNVNKITLSLNVFHQSHLLITL